MGGRPLVFGQHLRQFLALPATGPELATGTPDLGFGPHRTAPLGRNESQRNAKRCPPPKLRSSMPSPRAAPGKSLLFQE